MPNPLLGLRSSIAVALMKQAGLQYGRLYEDEAVAMAPLYDLGMIDIVKNGADEITVELKGAVTMNAGDLLNKIIEAFDAGRDYQHGNE